MNPMPVCQWMWVLYAIPNKSFERNDNTNFQPKFRAEERRWGGVGNFKFPFQLPTKLINWSINYICFSALFCIFPNVWHSLLLARKDISAIDCLFYFHQKVHFYFHHRFVSIFTRDLFPANVALPPIDSGLELQLMLGFDLNEGDQ